jgi:hypothetical protein
MQPQASQGNWLRSASIATPLLLLLPVDLLLIPSSRRGYCMCS